MGCGGSKQAQITQSELNEVRQLLTEEQEKTSKLTKQLEAAGQQAEELTQREKDAIKRREEYEAKNREAMNDELGGLGSLGNRVKEATNYEVIENSVEARAKAALWNVTGSLAGVDHVTIDWSKPGPVPFGKEMRQKHFTLDPNSTPLNHGSYGATPLPVLAARHQWEMKIQNEPVRFRFKDLTPLQQKASSKMAAFLGADPENFQFMPNANAAVSTVLKAIVWKPGDVIFMYSLEYDANKNAVHYIEERYGVEVVEVKIDLPCNHQHIIDVTTKKLEEMDVKPRMAIFNHITSATAYVMPAKKLIQLFHKHSIAVLCDGAQAPGQLASFNVSDINADFYVGTCHKWLYTCQGVAFLVVKNEWHKYITPLTVPYFWKQGYWKEFMYTGLIDFSPILATMQSLEFMDKVCGGFKKLHKYNTELADKAAHRLAEMWGTEVAYVDCDQPLINMRHVRLPDVDDVGEASEAQALSVYLLKNSFTAFVKVLDYKGKPTLFTRISANIYLDMDDFEKYGNYVLNLKGEYNVSSILKSAPKEVEAADQMIS
eukprot:Clim_evm198s157 gene=Clim_evmTU198s157